MCAASKQKQARNEANSTYHILTFRIFHQGDLLLVDQCPDMLVVFARLAFEEAAVNETLMP